MAEHSGYSQTQFTVIFKHVTSMTPCQWLLRERVRGACELLIHTNKSVWQILLDMGFGSRSQFHRAFRHVTKTTPARYRAITRHELLP